MSYLMYDRVAEISVKLDLLDFNIHYFLDRILDDIQESISSVDFVLNKYSWDGKKAYEARSHQEIVNEARQDKAYLLLKSREIKKILNKLK